MKAISRRDTEVFQPQMKHGWDGKPGRAMMGVSGKSGGGPSQSKTLARFPATIELREASWSAPVLWRFWMTCRSEM
jgi:hypothetical protein